MAEKPAPDAAKFVDGEGGYDYLARSVAIVTLLYERGILQELLDGGRITNEEVEQRLAAIREKFSFTEKK